MPFVSSFSSANIDLFYGGVSHPSARDTYKVRQQWVPATKVKGAWITLPNGSKFRKATALTKFVGWLEPGGRQATFGTRGGAPASVLSSPGGYQSDILQTSLSPNLRGAVGSFSKLQNAPVIPTAMQNESSTKALLKIASEKAGIGQDLATFRQTLDLIHKPGWSLVNAIKKAWQDKNLRPYFMYSEREIKHLKLFTRASAQTYLEYVYGFRPIMNDIYGIMEKMKEKGSKDHLLYGNGSSTQSGSTNTGSFTDISYNALTNVASGDETAHVHSKIWGRIDPNCPGLRSLNQLGLINPLAIAWDLVPWSFVVDWVLPIGPVLQALTAPAGLIFVDASSSVRVTAVAGWDHHNKFLDSSAASNTYASGVLRYEGYNRITHSGWPLPGVWVNEHPFSNNDRWLKALALAITNLRFLR